MCCLWNSHDLFDKAAVCPHSYSSSTLSHMAGWGVGGRPGPEKTVSQHKFQLLPALSASSKGFGSFPPNINLSVFLQTSYISEKINKKSLSFLLQFILWWDLMAPDRIRILFVFHDLPKKNLKKCTLLNNIAGLWFFLFDYPPASYCM